MFFFVKIAMYAKNCEILHFVHGSEAESQIEVFFDFFSFHYHLGTVSCQITFFQKTELMLSFSTKFYGFFLWRLQCTKKLRNSPLCPREWSSITYGSFLRFFLFSLPFRNSTMPNNRFSKNSIIWVFQRNFMFFLWRLQCTKKLRNSPLCPREWSSIANRSFLRLFLFSLPFRNSTMPNNRFSKNSIIWVFQRNFMFFLWRLQCTKKLRNSPLCPREWSSIANRSFLRFFLFSLPFRKSIMTNNRFSKKLNNLSFSTKFYVFFVKIAMYQKIAKFSTLSTGVKLNHKSKFSSIFSLFITI